MRTSETSPLLIAQVETTGGGQIGMSLCPGKHSETSMSGGGWRRDLLTDISAVKAWGACFVVILMESWELDTYKVANIGDVVSAHGMRWLHLPIVDGAAPTVEWDEAWVNDGALLAATLRAGNRIFVHCLGGRGRTGTVAALLLMMMGASLDDAIQHVRAAREGAIETAAQEAYLQNKAKALL